MVKKAKLKNLSPFANLYSCADESDDKSESKSDDESAGTSSQSSDEEYRGSDFKASKP